MPRAAWRTCLHQHKAILDCRWVSPRTSSLVSSLSTLENMKNFVWSCHDHVQSFLYCSRIGILWNLPPFYIVLAYCGVAGWTSKRISILQYCLNCTVSWKSACCNLQISDELKCLNCTVCATDSNWLGMFCNVWIQRALSHFSWIQFASCGWPIGWDGFSSLCKNYAISTLDWTHSALQLVCLNFKAVQSS